LYAIAAKTRRQDEGKRVIETAFGYLLSLLVFMVGIYCLRKYLYPRFFDYVPAIVIVYFGLMLCGTLDAWKPTSQIVQTSQALKSILLPMMIYWLLLHADMRRIIRLGWRMIGTFLLASSSLVMGFAGMYLLMHPLFTADAWRAFAALSGSWMGGTGNMVAIQEALDVTDSAMGYVLLVDSIDYAIWVMLLLLLVPYAKRFNQWSGGSTEAIDRFESEQNHTASNEPASLLSLVVLLGLGLSVSFASQVLATHLPAVAFFTTTTWIVLIATMMGILSAMTRLSRLGGSDLLGSIALYVIVALIASRADLAELGKAPLYVAAGFVILLIHAVIMLLFARLFKLDLFTIGVASLANIGGIASAPILAGTYSRALVPIGVLMALMGYILGTFGGLLVAKLLWSIGQ
jgi:uncharacterized membrane protein